MVACSVVLHLSDLRTSGYWVDSSVNVIYEVRKDYIKNQNPRVLAGGVFADAVGGNRRGFL